jgi:hypothetical protein
MPENDDFLERLRGPAESLRYRPDPATLERIRLRILERIEQPQPTVAELLARWLRPVAAAFALAAITAAVGLAIAPREASLDPDASIQVSMGGETYRVGD